MNEDDTFNALKRIPFSDMHSDVMKYAISNDMYVCDVSEEFFKKRGWDKEDYHKENSRRFAQIYHILQKAK